MGPDVSKRSAWTAPCRVGAPLSLFLSRPLKRGGKPILHVFHLNQPDRTEFSSRHHFARLSHQRVAGVVVRHTKYESRAPHSICEIQRIFERGGERFIADHVDACFEECLCRSMVHVVGGHDRNHFDAIGQRRFPGGHFLKAAVTNSYRSSRRAAMRCTAPMKAPGPPPTMPSRKRRLYPSLVPSIGMRT